MKPVPEAMDDPWFADSPIAAAPPSGAWSVMQPPPPADTEVLSSLEPHAGGIGALLGAVRPDRPSRAEPLRDPRREALLEALALTSFALYVGLGIASLWMRWE
jgi:hypothetical protein